jgi:hypothetical protein
VPPHTPTRGDQGDPLAAGDDQASLGHAIDRGKGDRRGGQWGLLEAAIGSPYRPGPLMTLSNVQLCWDFKCSVL